MTKHWTPASQIRALKGRRLLRIAEGILVALRRCDTDAALQELISASHKHAVPVFATAAALIGLVDGQALTLDLKPEAVQAAQREWGRLLRPSRDGAASRQSAAAAVRIAAFR